MKEQKEQVLGIITQAINIAVGSGAFKNTKDVAVINQALEFLEKDYTVQGEDDKEVLVEAPKESKKA